MAFPSVVSTARTTDVTIGTTDATINLPGSIVVGNTLLVLVRKALETSLGFPAGWNELFDSDADASDDAIACAWRKADGSEGATITVTGANATKYAAIAWQFGNAADPNVTPPEVNTLTTGTSISPDSGSLSPTGGAKDYLWISLGGWEGEQTSPPTYPTDFTVGQLAADTGLGSAISTNVRVAGACRELNAASLDPGAYTIDSSDDWTMATVVIYPATVSPALAADAGSYTVTGSAAGLLASRALAANSGSYAVSGAAADLRTDRVLSADAGAYLIAGTDVVFAVPERASPEVLAYGAAPHTLPDDYEAKVRAKWEEIERLQAEREEREQQDAEAKRRIEERQRELERVQGETAKRRIAKKARQAREQELRAIREEIERAERESLEISARIAEIEAEILRIEEDVDRAETARRQAEMEFIARRNAALALLLLAA